MHDMFEGAGILARAAKIARQADQGDQPSARLARLSIGLDEATCDRSVDGLNQLLADTMTIRDLYNKYHWQVVGHTFHQLHALFEKHADEQARLIDQLAERIQLLGGASIALAHEVADRTSIPRPPDGREPTSFQLSRLLFAHEIVLKEARSMARLAAHAGDDGTNDLIVSGVIRTGELQAWAIAAHVVDAPPLRPPSASLAE